MSLRTLLDLVQPALQPALIWGAVTMSWLELLAFALSLAMVACNLRVHPAAWPLAIVASLLYALLFLSSRLYGEAGLQIFFAVVALWGWWQWRRGRGRDGGALRVSRLGRRPALLLTAATLAAWPVLAWLLARLTDSDVPRFDAAVTAASLAGQWLLGRKYQENWAVWLVVNIASVVLFAFKGLWLTVLLYAILIALSVQGWRAWGRLLGRIQA